MAREVQLAFLGMEQPADTEKAPIQAAAAVVAGTEVEVADMETLIGVQAVEVAAVGSSLHRVSACGSQATHRKHPTTHLAASSTFQTLPPFRATQSFHRQMEAEKQATRATVMLK